jgi:translation initiation factor 2 subunit 3
MKVDVQPEVNIGMIGHVDHGKTTLTEALSGEWTDRHSEEIRRGISIRLGYADTTFYRCPECGTYGTEKKCKKCGAETEMLRAVSFVDAPGHETLMATMLSGASLMDGALLLIAPNEKCPQPQTTEHLMALNIAGVRNIVVVQNKIDLVSQEEAYQNYKEIKEFLRGSVAENAPIIPVSAHHDVNISVLIETIEKTISTPERDRRKPARLFTARSFDINTPGKRPKDLKGGVIGGSLVQGVLRVGDEIEIAPGIKEVDDWAPLRSRVVSLHAGGRPRKEIGPGGLAAVGTELDPQITKSDSLNGRVIGIPGTLPPVRHTLTVETHLLDRVVGSQKEIEVESIKTGEPLMMNIGTTTTVGVVKSGRAESAEMKLKLPICAEEGQRVAISRRIGNKWRLIGYGIITG